MCVLWQGREGGEGWVITPIIFETVRIQWREWSIVTNALGNCERDSRGGCGGGGMAEGLLSQVHFDSWIILWNDFMSPVLNVCNSICLFCCLSVHIYRTQFVKRIWWLLCPDSRYALLPCFHTFLVIVYSMCQEIVVILVCPEKGLRKGLFKRTSLAHCFLCYVHV